MSAAERQHFQDLYARSQRGHAFIQAERDRELKNVVTAHAVQTLRTAFAHASALPARPSSGLVEFYRALGKSR